MKNIMLISYSFIAALIGAGFASGQEILCYFVKFGKNGIFGIFIFAVFFTLFLYTVLTVCIKHNYHTFDSFLSLYNSSTSKKFIKISTTLFSFSVYSAMLSAAGASLYLLFNIPVFAGSLLSAFLCTILLNKETDTVFNTNGILGIFLATGIIICCLYMMRYREYHVFSPSVTIAGNACVYAGYNFVSIIPMIAIMSRKLQSARDAATTALITGGVILLIMLLMFCLISVYANKIQLGELPMLTLARRQNTLFSFVYCVLLSSAIATTLFSSGAVLKEACSISVKSFFLLSLFAWCLSLSGFENLVNTAYRMCGITGFVVCVLTVISCKLKK